MSTVSTEFLDKFREGYTAYEEGDWSKAEEILKVCLTMNKDSNGNTIKDGPTNTLLHVMEEHNFVAPKSWKGFRELTEK